MAIVKIAKLKHRSGNLVDLPQLSDAELGWANDEKRLFIGKESPAENVEVITAYSTIEFSQINGVVGNINISNTANNGQVLAFDGNDWVNKGRGTGGLITLGDISNVKIDGGAIGYVLETDGTGNLAWTPKGSLYNNVLSLEPDTSNTHGYGANAVIMGVVKTTPYTNGTKITITGMEGNGNSNVNSRNFYVKLSNNYGTTGEVILFNTSDLANANVFIDGSIDYVNPPDAIATALLGTGGGGVGGAGGSTTSVQYNNGNMLDGDANFVWDFGNLILTVTGNANIGNIHSAGTITASRLISNVSNGTAPLTVTSTTKVANLNVDRVDGYDTSIAVAANTIVVRNTSGNIEANNVIANTVAGNVIANTVAGTLTTAAQPNITSVGTLTTLTVTGNIATGGILTNNYYYANGVPLVITNYGNANVANYLPTYGGNLGNGSATFHGDTITTGANVNPGTITGTWTLTAGSTLEATYADLAEYYSADGQYDAGTVLEIGGPYEVTLGSPESTSVIGIVSSNPAYLMNKGLDINPVAIALQGRVPCKVIGPVKKGDMMISAGNGIARAEPNPKIGSVIGKALENYTSTQLGQVGMIEVAVGRL